MTRVRRTDPANHCARHDRRGATALQTGPVPVRLLLCFSLGLALAGCGGAMGLADNTTAPASNSDQAGESDNAGPDALSAAQRLDRIEQDLASLQITLSRLEPALDTVLTRLGMADPPPPAPSLPTAGGGAMLTNASASQASASKAVLSPGGTKGTGGTYAVHLASYRKPESALGGWRDISREHPSLIGALTPVVAKVSLKNRGIFYRLKAGPFESWDGANRVCEALEDLNWRCAVLNFEGVPLTTESATTISGS